MVLPNVEEVMEATTNENRLIYIKAIRDIKADEELLWNYGKNFDPAAF